VQGLCARGEGIQIKKKKALVGDMRRGIDNYYSVSADIVEFVGKSGECDKILVKEKKNWAEGAAISTFCIFRFDTPCTASARHALLFFLCLLYHVV